MDPALFIVLALRCAPQVDVVTVRALVDVESAGNPYAIGVVGGSLTRQPMNLDEAVSTAQALRAAGRNFSLGLAQINVHNFDRLGLRIDTAFDPCSNLRAMQTILGECLDRASQSVRSVQRSLREALSCYYSGNFTTGFAHGYVRRVALAASRQR